MKKIISILTLGAVSITVGSNASALSYSDNVGVNFTFDQSLTVSLSSADIVINNLAPGSSSDSNVIDINVLSNNLSGYTLSSTVGDSTHTNPSYDNTNLTHTSNSSNTFASLSTSDSVSDLSTYDTSDLVDPNVWGYSYSDQTVDNPTWTNYSGLPLYNTTGTTLKTSTTPSAEGGDTIKFKIAAKASTSQPSGEYRNVINFTVTAEHNPASFYDAFKEAATKDPAITTLNGYYKMQDMSPSICESVELYDDDSHIQLIDTRDHEVYYIGKLKDNRCWLLDNLRLGSNDYEIPLTPEDTNIAKEWVLPKGITSNYGSYVEPRISAAYKNDVNTVNYGAASGKIGVYYNYCAASGGTYCHGWTGNTGDAMRNICPLNWRLPTGGQNGESVRVFESYDNVVAAEPESIQYSMSIVLSGSFMNGQAELNIYGDLWLSTYSALGKMDLMRVEHNAVSPVYSKYRNNGNSVRCIASD